MVVLDCWPQSLFLRLVIVSEKSDSLTIFLNFVVYSLLTVLELKGFFLLSKYWERC